MRPNDVEVPEAQWIGNAQRGDSQSFSLLFDRYYAMIHSFAYRVCLIEAEADDITQETFIRAARGMASYRGESSFKNWLYRIAHNCVTDWQRKTLRQRDGDAALTFELDRQSQTRPADFDQVHTVLRQLAPELREAVALVFFEEMNHRQAAQVLGCAETTISWRIFRAKRLLKKLLRPELEVCS
jgi:RNA polymerase sigma-70 factor (ECF subfamily)